MYRIRLAQSAAEHLAELPARDRTIVLDAMKAQLQHEPFRETRHKKRLRPNLLAAWELRVGALRVFYEEDAENAGVVNLLAIGVKRRDRLIIGGQEIRI